MSDTVISKKHTGPQQKPSWTPLWIMIAIFAAPVIAAWFFYLNPEFLPQGRTNNGELIHPVQPLPADLALTAPDREDFDTALLEGKWTLVYLGGATCAEACLDRLIAMRQIRLALGEGRQGVERLLLLTDPAARESAADLQRKLDGMRVALTDKEGGRRLLALLGGQEGADARNRVYILDPMGNFMMRYAQDAPAEDILQDMERLLEASENWIEGAQYGHK